MRKRRKYLLLGITTRKRSWAQEGCDSLGGTVGGAPERDALGRVELTRNSLHLIVSRSELMGVRATKRDQQIGAMRVRHGESSSRKKCDELDSL